LKLRQRSLSPPRLMAWLFNNIARSEEHQTVSGDLDELYSDFIQEKGSFKASFWYLGQILSACPAFFLNYLYWRVFMFFNYLKLTIRNIRKHKAYSFINIAGLAIGIACCLMNSMLSNDYALGAG